MNAAKQIMEESSAKEVTFSNIAKRTKLSRPSIYKYYKFPEEILSNLLTNEMIEFNDSIEKATPSDLNELANLIVQEILNRDLMMKLLALNFPIIKYNVRDDVFLALREQIFTFKRVIQSKIKNMSSNVSDDKLIIIHYSLLTIMCSAYQLTHDDDYHIELMQKVNPEYRKPSYENLLENEILMVFRDLIDSNRA